MSFFTHLFFQLFFPAVSGINSPGSPCKGVKFLTTCFIIFITLSSGAPAFALTAGSVKPDQTICSGTVPVALNSDVASGGVVPYYYQWQQSTDGGLTWTNIAGATGLTYSPPALFVTSM